MSVSLADYAKCMLHLSVWAVIVCYCQLLFFFSAPYFPVFRTYSVRIQENTDQKNSVFGHFSSSAKHNAFDFIDGNLVI